MHIEFTGRVDVAEQLRGLAAAHHRSRAVVFAVCAAALVGGAALLTTAFADVGSSLIVCAVIVVYQLTLGQRRAIRKVAHRVCVPARFVLTDDVYRFESETDRYELRWDALHRIVETPEFFLLFQNSQQVTVLPGRLLTDEQAAELSAVLAPHRERGKVLPQAGALPPPPEGATPERLEFAGQVRVDEYVRGMGFAFRGRDVLLRVLAAVSLVLGVLYLLSGEIWAGATCVGAALFLIWNTTAGRRRAVRKAAERLCVPTRWTVTDEGISAVTATERYAVRWTAFHRLRETAEFFLLHQSPTVVLVLPKRLLAAEQAAELSALLTMSTTNSGKPVLATPRS
ncbi:YcxB family protein [Umezawaea beigongshangensis]|uniref:YcxB family protein n=1 Tax=Umezawaea beigongshangensis TaxID=2780383 RepID=UPI0018F25970|nr:YcxB family protein [Umezawaea beigongshangensis]